MGQARFWHDGPRTRFLHQHRLPGRTGFVATEYIRRGSEKRIRDSGLVGGPTPASSRLPTRRRSHPADVERKWCRVGRWQHTRDAMQARRGRSTGCSPSRRFATGCQPAIAHGVGPADGAVIQPEPHPARSASASSCISLFRRVSSAIRRFRSRAPAYGAGSVWYLDLGNGTASGQLYIGNALGADQLRGTFDAGNHTCRALPAPSVQAPELCEAAALPLPATGPDCAEAQGAGFEPRSPL
jgi:hypothetical protein